MTKPNYFAFYDYETPGLDVTGGAYTIASVLTDSNLNPISGKEINMMIRPRIDHVPHPASFLTHRLDMEDLIISGVSEYEASHIIQGLFSANNGTCVSGYNTSSFDDEITRHLFFQNMRRIYDHEWKNGNCRTDIFKLVQMIYAYRESVLEWPEKEGGGISMKLEDLSSANGITHENAHDALSDVYATIELARLIKQRRPQAFDYFMNLSNKKFVESKMIAGKPFLYTHMMNGSANHYSTLMMPICMDMQNRNKYICIDLNKESELLMTLSGEEIRRNLFTKREDLPEGSPKIPLQGIQINQSPIILEIGELDRAIRNNEPQLSRRIAPALVDRFNLDIDLCTKNINMIGESRDLPYRVQEAFQANLPEPTDVYRSIYTGGFATPKDEQAYQGLHQLKDPLTSNEKRILSLDVRSWANQTDDVERNYALCLRMKWNNFHEEILSKDELKPYEKKEMKEWLGYLRATVLSPTNKNSFSTYDYRAELAKIEIERPLSDDDMQVIAKVTEYIDDLESTIAYMEGFLNEMENTEQLDL